MVPLQTLVCCLLALSAQTRGTVIEERDGEQVLESVLHFHDGAQSVPEQNLSEVLLLISNRSAAGDPELPADPQVGPGRVYWTGLTQARSLGSDIP